MTPTFNFIKVAAGEPFPFETGKYLTYNEDRELINAQAMPWTQKETVRGTWYILRPVPPPAADGGREAVFSESEVRRGLQSYDDYNQEEIDDFIRLLNPNWPAAGEAEPGMGRYQPAGYWVDEWVKVVNEVPTDSGVYNTRTTSKEDEKYYNAEEERWLEVRRGWDTPSPQEWQREVFKPAPSAPSPVTNDLLIEIVQTVDRAEDIGSRGGDALKRISMLCIAELNARGIPPEKIPLLKSAPSPVGVTREEAEQWIQSEYPIRVKEVHLEEGTYFNMDIHAPIREVLYRLFDYLQGKAITPADRGSQVEAVDAAKLLEWVGKNRWEYNPFAGMWLNRENYRYDVRHAELIALYQQSL